MEEQNPLDVPGSSPRDGVGNLLGEVEREEYTADWDHWHREEHVTEVPSSTESKGSTAVGKNCTHELRHANLSIFRRKHEVRLTCSVPFGQKLWAFIKSWIRHFPWELTLSSCLLLREEKRASAWYPVKGTLSRTQSHLWLPVTNLFNYRCEKMKFPQT